MIYHQNIFERIKLFFQKLLKNNKSISDTHKKTEILPKDEGRKFMKDIKISDEKINIELQKMQKDFEEGIIEEEDLCELEIKELRKLYIQQIEEKKKSIEQYKKRILKVKEKITE